MTITIHRGIDQIGGCITEIASDSGTKILIDLGHNLPDGDSLAYDKYDNSEELDKLLDGVNAIFYTHPHGDHIGFEVQVAQRGIPQYIGETSKELMLLLKGHIAYTGKPQPKAEKEAFEKFSTFRDTETVKVDSTIMVTPYFVSHSAPDAYMFLIECDNRVVLHTGDFRDHGYRGGELMHTITQCVTRKEPDVLIIEGTMLNREDKRLISEEKLKCNAVGIIGKKKNVFVMCSSMDADRIASFYQAAMDKEMMFVVDGYQWKVLEKIENTLGKECGLYHFPQRRYFAKHQEEIRAASKANGFVMLVRNNYRIRKFIDTIYPELDSKKTCFIYSQFTGYIFKEHSAFQQRTFDFVHSHDWEVKYLHTSGHASKETLTEVCTKVDPKLAIIPIHREAKSEFRSLDLPQELKEKVVADTTVVEDVKIIIKR
ncbi:MAG: MBL fold metallo-hydrolase [Bacteroidales bacterium]|nr:MBL fold metallo-hydrolase [Bacteroidales bacterium]